MFYIKHANANKELNKTLVDSINQFTFTYNNIITIHIVYSSVKFIIPLPRYSITKNPLFIYNFTNTVWVKL